MRIAVLGGGNGAHQMAADLTLAGLKVNMFEMPRFKENVEKLLRTGEIETFGGAREGKASLNMASTDIEKVLEDVKHIFIVVPAFAHRPYAELLASYLKRDQTVTLFPGTLGTLEFVKVLRDEGVTWDLTVAETDTLPWACRLVAPATVKVYHTLKRFGVGVFPSKRSRRVTEFLEKIFPIFTHPDVISCGLSSLNPTLHAASVLLNVGRIEYSRGEFYLYEEGITPSVARVVKAVDKERLAIGKAWGYDLTPVEEDLYLSGYGPKGNLWQAVRGSSLTFIKGPTSIESRYLTEDVPYGLVPWVGLAGLVGLDVPVMKSVVWIVSALHGRDYWSEGRTLEKLGISDLSVEEIKRFVAEGEK